ncbi:transcription factor TFIIIB component B'' homolog isoform X3 [Sciurus carolinensis]|uniref:transcription factor TFIIIB component B'' homolog isoform X3 n=1 Tax=Sciurus carolinensis TaxID=30640 RepID=UPI001FB4761B|nr:transcription factor TFIIIB component B'' homolog isoform X3 [Sciurus carolinensis]
MFRRARLSVKPNVRPGVGARGSTAPNPHRGRESPRPPEPTAESAPKPLEHTDVPAVDSGGAELQEKAPRSSDEKIASENNVEESNKLSSTVSQRRKRISSTSSLVKPSISLPSQSHPLSIVNQDAPQPNPIPTKEKQPCSDRYRIYKAQKLREMLKEELRKEKKQWKNKYAINESQRPPDRSKMTMRDFIYYLPDNNPMTSSLEQEKKTEKSLTPVQSRDRQENKSTVDVEDNEEVEEETDDGPLLVPRVKVAEDGSIILDEESLTVEVLRTKGPCVVEENDPIFERGSTTTYSSFRKNYYSKPWSNKETDMFFLAISMVGTDFSMIGQLFPHRARIEIKNKFKREEKTNGWRIDKAFQEKRPFDFDFFAHLLQKVLAEEEKRKQKSVKSQSLKEKKPSKPRKNVKVKKVASEGVNDDPDESLSTKISDTQEYAQMVEEESLISPEQDLEQVALEQDRSERKRRRKNQDDANEQEVKNLLGNASVQSAPFKGEKHKNTSLSSRPEVNEGECNMEQKLLCAQNRDDSMSLASGEKVEKRADPVLSESNQQDTMLLATESSELSTSDFLPSEVGIRTSCEVNNAESSTGERSVDLNNKSLETDQVENVKPILRGRLQKPKPNLSRAVGKKSVLLRNKTDAESKNSCSETSVDKNHMEKNKMNSGNSFEMENTERENLEAETMSNLNEKTCLQKDNQPKAFRPSRPVRGRLPRPKPNIEKTEERKEILESQEKIGIDIQNNENESCVDRDIPQQMEDQSCKNFSREVSHVISERKDSSFQKVQPDEPKTHECPSIQEDKQANVIKQVPVSRTRFQKPKPNTGRRREISSKEEVPEEILASGEMTAALTEIVRLDALPREKVSVTTTTAKETKSDLKETGRDISLSEKMPEMTDVTLEMQTGLKAIEREISPRGMISEMTDSAVQKETDLKTPGRESFPREKVQKLIDAIEEIDRNLEETGIREISPQENVQEIKSIGEMETDLKETEREMPTRDRTLQKINVTEEGEADLEETEGREISAFIMVPEEVKTIDEMKTDPKEIRGEISQREKVLVKVSALGEREIDLKETGRDISLMETISGGMTAIEGMEADLKDTGRDIALMETISEKTTTIEGIEADLKDMGRDISLMETISEKMTAIEGIEADLKDTGRDIALMETISGEMITTEGMEADLKDTGRKNSLKKRGSVKIGVTEEIVADLEKPGKIEDSPRENESEEPGTSEQTEANVMQSNSVEITSTPSLDMKTISSEVLSVMHIPTEENRNSEKEVSCHLSHLKISSQTSELGETEDQGIRPPDVPEQFSDINLSKSLPQEQKPREDKPAPFLRSKLKRPKPNLTRAILKKETTEAQKYVPGKKLETDKVETIVIQQDSEQVSTFTSQHDVSSIITSEEKDKSSHKEEAVTLPCIQTEKDPSPSNSHEPKEESQSAQTQENELVVSTGTPEMKTFPQEVKESVIQTSGPVRGRLQRPKPNVRKARPRQIVENDEAKGIIKEERSILQKNESSKKSLTVSNSQFETEIEVPSKVSECRIDENQSHVVLVENLHINERNVLDEKMRHENKPYVASPAPLIRRKFQKTKPNLGRVHSKKQEPGIEKGTYQSRTSKQENNLQQRGNSDICFFPKEKTENLSSMEVSARKDFVDSRESSLAKKDAQLEEVGPSGSVGEENVGTNSVCSVVEERYLSKLPSRPQLLKESNSSKIALDRRTTITATASECEIDHSERRIHRKIKPNVTKGRGSKRTRGKTSKKEPRASKSMLVTLRASQEEDEDDDDFESDYEEENYHLAPEELNKAPVFVPVGLRSPEPVPAQIEETMEELEITENVADIGCVTVVEHHLSNTDVATQEVKEEKYLDSSSFEITASEQTQDEPGTNDGSTEAAITLLTMGDLVLQSEISTEQGDVGVCVFPDVQSKDKSHIPFNPDNVNHKIVHEYQELSSPVITTSPASFEENKIVLEEQSTREVGLMQEVKENATLTRNTTSKVTSSLRMRSRFVKPKPNLEKVLRTKRFHAYQKNPSFCVLKGEEVEIQRETEKNASKATELEEKSLGQVTTTESKEQNKFSCVHGIKGTSISQEANLTERNEDQEERSQEVQIVSVTPIVSTEQGPYSIDLGRDLGESSVEEPLRKDTKGDSVLTLPVPECIPTSIPEVQQENVINSEDLTVNLIADVHQDEEDEEAFILTLVEIPTNATEDFADATSHLMPNPLLPAPILVKSVNTEEIDDMSKSLPLTTVRVGQDAMCLSNSARDDSEEPPANLDLISRKRFHCRLDESNHVPPAKKISLTSRDDCQQYTSEVCSKKLNVFEETGESYKGRGIFPTSGCAHATTEPQKEKLETTFQNIGSRTVDKIRDTCIEKNMPQDEMVVSDKEKRTDSASTSEQMGSRTTSSKTSLSRPGRRPLGFLSLICSKNNLESDEPTHVHSKKRLKPLIPVSRRNLKRSNPLNEDQKKNQESSDLLPSPSVVIDTQSENIGSSSAQVSCDQPLLKEERKTGQNQAREREPTTVSEYFFSDIFIEVDETE